MDRDFRLLAAPIENSNNKNAKIETNSLNSNQVQEENLNKNDESSNSPNDLQTSLPSNKASKERVGGKGEAKKKWEIIKRKASLGNFFSFSFWVLSIFFFFFSSFFVYILKFNL